MWRAAGLVLALLAGVAATCTASPLLDALEEDDLERAAECVRNGADLNAPEGKRTPLSVAIDVGSVRAVSLLCKSGADPNAGPEGEASPLERAVYAGEQDIARVLVAAGARHSLPTAAALGNVAELERLVREAGQNEEQRFEAVNADTYGGLTLLAHAAVGGHAEAAKLLLAKGANPAYKDSWGEDALLMAAKAGHKEVVELLAAQGQPITVWAAAALDDVERLGEMLYDVPSSVSMRCDADWAPLHFAAWRGAAQAADFLIDSGAGVNVVGDGGRTPLHLAASQGKESTIGLLLRRGADINAKTRDGQTPLRLAAAGHHVGAMTLLLKAQPDLGFRDGSCVEVLNAALEAGLTEAAGTIFSEGDLGKYVPPAVDEAAWPTSVVSNGVLATYGEAKGGTCLHLAVQRDCPLAVAFLLDKGLPVDATDATGSTALHWAAAFGRRQMADLLLSHGAYVKALNSEGVTPLWAASVTDSLDVVDLLLAKGAEHTLHTAAACGDTARVQALLANGVDVDARTGPGLTPLLLALANRKHETAVLLLKQGASTHIQTPDGCSPLWLAASWAPADLVSLLLDRGAAINLPAPDGTTPLHAANSAGNLAVVSLLLAKGANPAGMEEPSHSATYGDRSVSPRPPAATARATASRPSARQSTSNRAVPGNCPKGGNHAPGKRDRNGKLHCAKCGRFMK